MFLSIFRFELRYWLRNPAVYFYSFIFLLLGLAMMAGSAGVFGSATGAIRIANSPFSLYSFLTIFNKLILFILPAIIGNSIYRDFKSRCYQVMYTFPFAKWEYLAGKFLSSLLVVFIISAFAGLGLYMGTQLPGTNKSLLIEFDLAVYLQLYAVYVLPTILLFSSMVFAIVSLSRNVYTGFIIIVLILIGRELLSRIAGISGNTLALLAEPLGETATLFATRNWTIAEQNTRSIPYVGFVLLNRFVWILIGSSILAFTYRYFLFSQLRFSIPNPFSNPSEGTENDFGCLQKLKLSAVQFNYNWLHQLKLVWRLSQADFIYILKSGSFISILLAGSILIAVLITQMNPPYETRILPVTWVMLAFPIFFFSLLVNFLTFLYAGILIHRGRNTRMNELLDVNPVSNTVLAFSKLLALVKMQVALLGIVFLSGIAVQIYAGFYQFEVGHYLFDLLAIHLPGFLIWAIAAVFVQTIISNSYIGLFILILGYFGVSQLQLLGISSFLFQFNQDLEPGFFIKYSDMNGHGHSLIPYFILKAYWGLFGMILFMGTIVWWSRGTSQTVRTRILLARVSFTGKMLLLIIISISLVIIAGFTINRLENESNSIPSEAKRDQITRNSEKKYGHFKNYLQPRIVNVDVTMHLYPEKQTFESTGLFTLINKSDRYLDTLLVNYSHDVFTHYEFDKVSETVLKDSVSRFNIHRLKQPLAPNDSLHLSFTVKSIPNNWLYQNSFVLANGTFITSLIYPGLGYYSTSKSHDLQDSIARQNHYRSIDSDYISFKATVSTSADQIAIAPGYLTKEWIESGRNFFQYQSTSKVTNDYAFTSGRYHAVREKFKGINIEIYHHPRHTYNANHFMNGLKATLTYCEKYFGAYQHDQIRIIEYSRKVGDFAQSFANTIPMSERSFIMDIDEANPKALNLSFLGASHELAHQWWGHQLIPADVDGSRMITESMAEYVSLCVLEREYGKEKGKLFRRKALDIYLKKRLEDEEEKTLMRNSGIDKSYIPYQKGSLALYALRDFIGEDKLNAALSTYLQKSKFQKAPYTTSDEMVDYLRQVTPDSLRYLIHDLFETVTLYDNRLKDYDVTKLPNGKYQVVVNLIVTKFRSENGTKVFADNNGQALIYKDGQSVIHSLPLSDYIELGIYSSNGDELHLKKYLVTNISNKVTIVVDQVPGVVAVDPLFKLLNVH